MVSASDMGKRDREIVLSQESSNVDTNASTANQIFAFAYFQIGENTYFQISENLKI